MPIAKPSIWVLLLLLSEPAGSIRADDDCFGLTNVSCDALTSCDVVACSSAQGDDPWELFGDCSLLDKWGVVFDGQLAQGITTNSRNPINPAAGAGNLPATSHNYRNDEYMLNSLYLTVGRETDTGGSGWDISAELIGD